MPRYEPPPADVEQSVSDIMQKLDTWPRLGKPIEQFWGLYAVCSCGMAVSRRMFDSHDCIERVNKSDSIKSLIVSRS